MYWGGGWGGWTCLGCFLSICPFLFQDYLDALMGVCYDGVEGLLYLSLFSLLAACALSIMLCIIFRFWTLIGSRSAPERPFSNHYTPGGAAALPRHNTLTRLSLPLRPVSPREKEYDDIDEEDPFNPEPRRISYNPRRSNIQSFCSYTSSMSSQASLPAPPQTASNVLPPPEYM